MRIRWTVSLLVIVAATGVWAQEKKLQDPAESKELNERAYVRLLRSDLKTKKEAIIKEDMQLTPQQAAAFWPIYKNYDAEQNKLIDQKLGVFQDYAQNFMTMNDEKADQIAQKVIALDDQRLALRKKYYQLMKSAIPTVLVVRFFHVENQIQSLMDLQIDSTLPIVEQATE
ncbi:MAG: hypothetical protein ABSA29_00800 [Terriglobales bacterium]|jgi:hypothetical protein